MSDVHDNSIAAEASRPAGTERRRPGRKDNVSPDLIPLLRGDMVSLPDHEEYREHALAPAIGIMVSVLISGLLWAALFWLI